jgi:hypothetical protein
MAACGMAQETMKPVGLSVRAGFFMPTDSNTRAGGTGWFAFGVDYKLRERMMADSHIDRITVSLDYAAHNNYRVVPLLVNFVRHNGPIFYSAGIGAAFSRRPIAFGMVEDRTRFAYQVGIGYEFQTSQFPLFVEGKFFGNERPELNGVGVYAGVRF